MASREDGQLQEAPFPLETVRLFLNTWDGELDTEALTTPADLGRWLAAHALVGVTEPPVTQRDFDRAIELREALRTLATGHATGSAPDPAALALLNRTLERERVEVRFGADAVPSLVPAADQGLGRIAALVATAAFDGTWGRLKACPECGWSIYDRSKNRSRSWCRMAECGNRAKARAFRARKAADAALKQA
ncbi:MAG TPA: ABATE domain-containing protein [Actinospica sp.]|nr:ABATE domain-containing protein [Actinospica sp.]